MRAEDRYGNEHNHRWARVAGGLECRVCGEKVITR